MTKLSQLSKVGNPSTLDYFIMVRGSGGSSQAVQVSFEDMVSTLGLEVIPREKVYQITFADTPFTVPDKVCTVFVDTTGGEVDVNLKAVSPGNTCSLIRTTAGANNVVIASSSNINGAGTYSLTSQYDRAVIKANSTEYFLLSE